MSFLDTLQGFLFGGNKPQKQQEERIPMPPPRRDMTGYTQTESGNYQKPIAGGIRVMFPEKIPSPTPTPPPPLPKATQAMERVAQGQQSSVSRPNVVYAKDNTGTWRVMSREEAPKPTMTPTPTLVQQPTVQPTPSGMFKRERDEEGPIGDYIRSIFPPEQHRKIPVILDGENGGRVANMVVENGTGKRYFLNDPAEVERLAEERKDKNGVDIGIMQINSNTFRDFQRRKRGLLEQSGIMSIGDLLDARKNIIMGRIVWDEQGWGAWHGAPAAYKQ